MKEPSNETWKDAKMNAKKDLEESSQTVAVRLTANEKARLKSAAEKTDLTITNIMRAGRA